MTASQCRYTHDRRVADNERWRCPHETYEEYDRCVFHLPPEHTPGPGAVSRAFQRVVNGDAPAEFIGVTFEELHLSGATLDAETEAVRVEAAEVSGDVVLDDAVVTSPLVLSGIEIGGSLRARRARLADVKLSHATVDGTVTLADARVYGPLFIRREVEIDDGIDLSRARLQRGITVHRATLATDLVATDLRAGRTVTINQTAVAGEVNLTAATVAGVDLSALRADRLTLDEATVRPPDARDKHGDGEMLIDGCTAETLSVRQATVRGRLLVADNEFTRPVVAAGIDLVGAGVSTADLAGANLRGAVCRRTTVRNADLAGATLVGADLAEADLTGSTLTGADLRDARLTGAICREVVFDGAVLDGAILDGSDCKRAVFGTASLCNTSLVDVALESTTFARHNRYDPAAAGRTDGGHDGVTTTAELLRAIESHRRVHALLAGRDGSTGAAAAGHDLRALALRARWYRRHALGGDTGHPERAAGDERRGTETGLGIDTDDGVEGDGAGQAHPSAATPGQGRALLGAIGYGLGYGVVRLGTRLRSLLGVVVLSLFGFAVAYPFAGGLRGASGTLHRSMTSVAAVRDAGMYSLERLLTGATAPVRWLGDLEVAIPDAGVTPLGGAARLAAGQELLGTVLVATLGLAVLGRLLRVAWARAG